MKDFFKTFFAALLANIVGGGCIVIFFFIALTGVITSALVGTFGGNNTQIAELRGNTILKVDVSSLNDIVEEDPFAMFNPNKSSQTLSLSEIVRTIAEAKNNPNISALYLNVEDIAAGMASVDELRRALQDFKKSDKPIIAYGDAYTQKAYYLASVADKVLLNPEGIVYLNGLASGNMMYKDALDKLGVKMEIFRVGTFKSAVEPFSQNRMSEANKTQVQEYLDGLWTSITEGIAQSRGLQAGDIKDFANQGKAFSAAQVFVDSKLVDSLVYRSEVASVFAQQLEQEEGELRMISLADMAMQVEPHTHNTDASIKVLFAEGEIMDILPDYWSSGTNVINYNLAKEIKAVEEDEDIKALVLRVNSPGGSAFLSEQIWHAMKSLRAKKPVVVSMGDLAASGGYYISAPANMIVAEPTTLTGSIGIFGMMPNASELVNKMGLYVDVVKTSEFADMEVSVPYRPLSEGQRNLIQRQVERGYDLFLSRVAEGRQMTKSAVDSVAQGRVWLGKRALELGLVDKLGGLDTAIEEAAKLAKVSDYNLDYGTTSKNYLRDLFESATPTDDFIARVRRAFLTKEERKALQMLHGATMYTGIQARLPYEFGAY